VGEETPPLMEFHFIPSVILSCIAIEILRFAFESFGLVWDLNNGMFLKSLVFNVLGGILGYLLGRMTILLINHYKHPKTFTLLNKSIS